MSNTTFEIETGKTRQVDRQDKDPFLLCGGATGEEDLQWCGWDNVLELNVTTHEISTKEYAALGLGEAKANALW